MDGSIVRLATSGTCGTEEIEGGGETSSRGNASTSCQQRAREAHAQALVQNQRAEFVEHNPGQWITQIEADETVRERLQEIQDHRNSLRGDGRVQGIVARSMHCSLTF
jgi:uncharacterized membrane protein YkoI